MSREIGESFDSLNEFVESYQIVVHADQDEFIRLLKGAHKRLFGFLTYLAEIEQKNPSDPFLSPQSKSYLSESGSDSSQALFCWLHGAYKPAYLSLRGSIETFLKGLIGTDDPDVFTEKSMYVILDSARDSTLCSGTASVYYSNLRGHYKDLCRITHTAKSSIVTPVTALGMFPKFEAVDAKKFIERFSLLIESYIAILLCNHRGWFGDVHYKNQRIILNSVTKKIKNSILAKEK